MLLGNGENEQQQWEDFEQYLHKLESYFCSVLCLRVSSVLFNTISALHAINLLLNDCFWCRSWDLTMECFWCLPALSSHPLSCTALHCSSSSSHLLFLRSFIHTSLSSLSLPSLPGQQHHTISRDRNQIWMKRQWRNMLTFCREFLKLQDWRLIRFQTFLNSSVVKLS